MTLAIRNSRTTVATNSSLVAAGADVPEANAAQRIAADPSVIDAERDPLYGDRVERNLPIVNYGADPHKTWNRGVNDAALRKGDPVRGFSTSAEAAAWAEAEKVRRARLSRWQEQR